MPQVDDAPMETLHIYLEWEQPPHSSLLPIILSVFTLFALVVYCALTPYQQPVTRMTLRVPAVPLAVRTFTAQAAIVPTGVKTYPAATAHGLLTITNGSVIAQTLPASLIFVSSGGVSVITDRATYVPPGSADGYGITTASAHVLTAGINLATLSINQTIGASLYVRNLQPFTGGRPAYSIKVITEEDRQLAVNKTRNILAMLSAGLHYPCSDVLNIGQETVSESWQCQFVTYHLPSYMHVTGIQIQGKNLIVAVWYVVRPGRIWVK